MNPSSSQSAVDSSVARMSGEFISVGEALKLVPPFKGNMQEVLAFIGNADTAFTVINPEQEAILYKFALMRISGEPRTAIGHRNLNNWSALKEFLQNSYIEKRMLDFHASQLFKAKQGKDDIDARNTDAATFMGAMRLGKDDQNLSRGERVISKLSDEHLNEEQKKLLREICFEYQDVFYLPGDRLSCTNAARHTIHLEPGTTPINTRP